MNINGGFQIYDFEGAEFTATAPSKAIYKDLYNLINETDKPIILKNFTMASQQIKAIVAPFAILSTSVFFVFVNAVAAMYKMTISNEGVIKISSVGQAGGN